MTRVIAGLVVVAVLAATGCGPSSTTSGTEIPTPQPSPDMKKDPNAGKNPPPG